MQVDGQALYLSVSGCRFVSIDPTFDGLDILQYFQMALEMAIHFASALETTPASGRIGWSESTVGLDLLYVFIDECSLDLRLKLTHG